MVDETIAVRDRDVMCATRRDRARSRSRSRWANDRLSVKVKKMTTILRCVNYSPALGISSFLRRDAARTSGFLSALFGNNKEESFLLRRRCCLRVSVFSFHLEDAQCASGLTLHNHDFVIVSAKRRITNYDVSQKGLFPTVNFTQ